MIHTIYALASASGKAGVGVVRLSGPHAKIIAQRILKAPLPAPRMAQLAKLYSHTGSVIDEALVLFFEGPNSFTGEDVVEFHIHGSRAVREALFKELGAGNDARMAEAGEFTRRAFLNGKLDLAQVEGLVDLIEAETEAQRKQALSQMSGALSALYEGWRKTLLTTLAYCEADIDFADEDLPANLIAQRMAPLQKLADDIAAHLNDHRRGERLREGLHIAILGAPNAGKSSLLNALAAREAAIVSARAGTTRDVVEVHLDLGGYAVVLADTAGLRDASDEIEQEGIARALSRAQSADLKLVLFDATHAPDAASLKLVDEKAIVVATKTDLGASHPALPARALHLSTRTGEGMAELLAALAMHLAGLMESGEGTPPLTRARHREALQQALTHIQSAIHALQNKGAPELLAEELRLSARALGRITGRVDVDDVLDVIFRDFCIGK